MQIWIQRSRAPAETCPTDYWHRSRRYTGPFYYFEVLVSTHSPVDRASRVYPAQAADQIASFGIGSGFRASNARARLVLHHSASAYSPAPSKTST